MNKTKVGEMVDNPLKWYLDYVNNFITLSGFCDWYGLTRDEGEYIVSEGKRLNDLQD